MRLRILIVFLALSTFAAPALAQPRLSAADKAAIYKTGGFKAQGGKFTRCAEDPSESHMFAAIEAADLNSDGLPEAFVRESSTYCYGSTEQAVVLLTKDKAGVWKVVLNEVGVDLVEKSRTKGWADITIGGPGLDAQPLFKFNGAKYVHAR
jgi:hypothetical protein